MAMTVADRSHCIQANSLEMKQLGSN